MIDTFKQIIKKYFKRNRKYLLSKNILHEMNGGVLLKINDDIFNFNGEMAEEVRAYCRNEGYEIDKIVFLSSYDVEIERSRDYNLKMQGDSKIKIIEEHGQTIAVLCIGEFVSIKDRG